MSQSTTHGSRQSSGIIAFVSLAISPDSAVPHSVTFSTITMLLHSFCNHSNYLYALVVVAKILLSVYNHHFNPYYTHTACSLSHSVSPTGSNGGICSTYLALHPAHPLSLHHHLAYQNILCGIVEFVLVLIQSSLFLLPGHHPSCSGIYLLMP